MAQETKHIQLGVNASTASNRLVKDILFNFVTQAGHVCYRCGKPLTRATFSIEHKIPWLHSAEPSALFFDLDNIAYSHIKCNVENKRLRTNSKHGTAYRYGKGCRCESCTIAKVEAVNKSRWRTGKRNKRIIRE